MFIYFTDLIFRFLFWSCGWGKSKCAAKRWLCAVDCSSFDFAEALACVSFSHLFNLGTVAVRLPVTFCRFAMGGIFTTNVYAEHKTFGYH
jgi:hypothetical protein